MDFLKFFAKMNYPYASLHLNKLWFVRREYISPLTLLGFQYLIFVFSKAIHYQPVNFFFIILNIEYWQTLSRIFKVHIIVDNWEFQLRRNMRRLNYQDKRTSIQLEIYSVAPTKEMVKDAISSFGCSDIVELIFIFLFLIQCEPIYNFLVNQNVWRMFENM